MQLQQDSLRAGLYMVAAAGSFVTNDTFVKLSGGVPVGETIAIRGGLSVVLVGVICGWLGLFASPRLILSRSVLMRAAFDLVATFLFITALLHMPIANLTSIIQAVPLAAVILAVLFLGERIGPRRLLAIAAGFLGVLLIARPSPSTFTVYEGLSLVIVLTAAMRDIVTRRIPPHVPSFIIAFANALLVTIGGALVGLYEGFVPLTSGQFACLAAASFFLSLGYVLMVMTIRLGDIAVTAPFRYVNVLFSILSGVVVFGEVPDGFALAGMALIVASGVYALRREALRNIARTQGK